MIWSYPDFMTITFWCGYTDSKISDCDIRYGSTLQPDPTPKPDSKNGRIPGTSLTWSRTDACKNLRKCFVSSTCKCCRICSVKCKALFCYPVLRRRMNTDRISESKESFLVLYLTAGRARKRREGTSKSNWWKGPKYRISPLVPTSVYLIWETCGMTCLRSHGIFDADDTDASQVWDDVVFVLPVVCTAQQNFVRFRISYRQQRTPTTSFSLQFQFHLCLQQNLPENLLYNAWP